MFRKRKSLLLIVPCLILSLMLAACAPQGVEMTKSEVGATGEPKYVFYLIGDGLGASQRQISEYYLRQITGDENAKLNMNQMPVAGINTTYSLDTLVTDSAAAGTALSSGVKTNNGYIATTPDGVKTTTLIEAIQEKGYATGIVTSTRLTHATPASFVAHNESRNDENAIAEEYLTSNVDFIAGGGMRNFVPVSYSGEEDAMGKTIGSKREDETDLVAEFEDSGYKTFTAGSGSDALYDYIPQAGDKVFAALTNSHMPYEVDRENADTNLMSLSELTQKAVDLLSLDKEGFMLMVEGGRIDHASHPNDVVATIIDTLEFDEVIKIAMDFYNANPDETMIIVVGDHETGGMGLGFGTDYFLNLDQVEGITGSFEDAYGFAYEKDGDRAAYFAMIDNLGIKNITDTEKEMIEAGMDKVDQEFVDPKNGYNYNEAGLAVNQVVSQRVGVEWTTYAHTGTQIPFGVMGSNQYQFGGFMDNTEIAQTIAQIMGITIG